MSGLFHPQNIDEWSRWQAAQKSAPRRLISSLRGIRTPDASSPQLTLSVRGDEPRILVALEATTPTQVASLIRPLEFLPAESLAVLSLGDPGTLPGEGWVSRKFEDDDAARLGESLTDILAVGHYLPAGRAALGLAERFGVRFTVIQHGLLAPQAPPLPAGAHLLAFSDADAAFWTESAHSDITYEVVGSQLLWQAAQQPADAEVAATKRPVFLGQLHGAELPRTGFASAAARFCFETKATYRPHPAEKDKLSLIQHALWERQGIPIDRFGAPLSTLDRPVASVFSTGVVEAAVRGLPAWVTYYKPPVWLEEFWERYGLSKWKGIDSAPTPVPAMPVQEPAQTIANIVRTQS
ncbi:hypothetical protein [Neomicrococcus aestuarii]|uniref:RNA-binding protein n=1 Tax=Neomicrococcus aestuarii TaxID=556325 RepID=A0A1L2ZMX2_9MICC|nr:hypothetical protein [Neomicrococcus aestuarii]APF40466.1 hypothetical protein BHE16_04895 [Neomicrococcus aestuarii]